MEKSHARVLERLQSKTDNLLNQLSKSDFQFIATRRNDKWSPLEQCYHVYLAEMMSRKYCIKKLSFNPELKDADIRTKMRTWALNLIEIAPFKFKAPENIDEQAFPKDLDFNMVRSTWSDDRQELIDFLNHLDPVLVNKEIYRQGTVGRLTIEGMLKFFIFHLDRHIKNIRRNYGIG